MEFELVYGEKSPHLSMIVTGFMMLRDMGKLDFSIKRDENLKGILGNTLLLAICGDKNIIFDMSDGYSQPEVFVKRVERSDFYLKRSYSDRLNMDLPIDLRERVYPLGLHYHVSYDGNIMDKSSLKESIYQRIFNGAERSYFTPEKFETKPIYNENLSVIFYTRLWNPSDQVKDKEYFNSIQKNNDTRIELVRKLRKEFGNRFIGGIQYSPFAYRKCGDLVAKIGETRRKSYLEVMKSSDICIGTTGLHDSIGWKTAEYVAAARAVVNERLLYSAGENFEENKNYLAFDSVDECLSKVDYLLLNPKIVYEMKLENENYYRNYLKPDKLVENAIAVALN